MNPPYVSLSPTRRDREQLEQLRRELRRDLWASRILALVVTVACLIMLNVITETHWPAEHAAGSKSPHLHQRIPAVNALTTDPLTTDH